MMFITPVRAATTSDIALSGTQTIDGVALADGDRVLVKDQTNAPDNGIYVVGSAAWSRAADFDQTSEVVQGASVLVIEGTAQSASAWTLFTADPITVGVTSLVWEPFPQKFFGSQNFVTDNGRVSITSQDTPLNPVEGVMHILNDGAAGVGLLVTSKWQGSAASPYTNNDNVLFTTYNNILDSSFNKSWALSANNAYHNIPVGVTDSGERIGVLGWATSVAFGGYQHAGTLASQYGVQGAVGFQGPGSAATAVIQGATAVRGLVYADSAGATIQIAQAGAFASDGGASTINQNFAIYARAQNGTVSNWSFYGEKGKLFNADQIIAGSSSTPQSPSRIAARKDGNSIEFGHTDPNGYGSNLGATFSRGLPFLAFCAEADPTGDTFRTRGKPGVVISSDLAGALVFSRVTNANASGQTLTESMRLNADGRPVIPSKTPASASAPGQQWEFAYDENYLYVCVAANTWKRANLSSW